MRKENRIIGIKQNFCQKSTITIKIEKQQFYLGKVSERGKEKRDSVLLKFIAPLNPSSLKKAM